MSSPPKERPIKLNLTLKPSQPGLLAGLDAWLRLGLLTDEQVKLICRQHLSSPLKKIKVPKNRRHRQVVPTQPALDLTEDFAPENTLVEPNLPTLVTRGRGIVDSLMAEISVRWLLFLGVFLVVVSSGVLAASQWEKFSAVGQYGVLLAYTLSFWGVSFWAGRQSNLGLTAQTLQVVTLLLVPVNFWAMDSFGLWDSALELATVAIASFTLTAITVLVFNRLYIARAIRFAQAKWVSILNILGLSYLHWGWHLAGFPLIAIYLGMVGTSVIAFYQSRRRTLAYRLIVVYALVVLLVRAIFVVRIELAQLGLAIGICGWILAWLEQQTSVQTEDVIQSPSILPWELIGGGLLFYGWLVSWQTTVPWQATAVSGLGLWFFSSRLQRFWLRLDVAALFIIGLQTIWLVWRLIPQAVRQEVITTLTQLTAAQDFPWALLGGALFPYLILVCWLTEGFYRTSKLKLASFGDYLGFSFGLALTAISVVNPTMRSLNLLLSTITLAVVTIKRSPTRVTLVYLTHIIGVLTLISTIDRFYPKLQPEAWAIIFLALMVIEWAYSVIGSGEEESTNFLWQQSAWHIGLALAALSYPLLAANLGIPNRQNWGGTWLITPVALTLVASQSHQSRRQFASWLSVITLIAVQILTLPLSGTRLIGLSLATALMFVNTNYLERLAAAVINVGFGLSFIIVLLLEDVPGIPNVSGADWFLVGAIVIASLWLTRGWLNGRLGTLAAIYAQACDRWAIALAALELLNLTFHAIVVYLKYDEPGFKYLISAAITSTVVVYRSWRHHNKFTVYGFRWGLQLTIFEIVHLSGGSLLNVSVVNIILSLIILFIGEWWRLRQLRVNPDAVGWAMPNLLVGRLPLVNALLGTVFRCRYFNSWTGLLSIGAAITTLGVSRRKPHWKRLAYLGLAGISLGLYELLIYQLIIRSQEGSYASGLTVLAILTIIIAITYRLLASPLASFLQLTVGEIKTTAHIHWALGSMMILIGAGITVTEIQVGLPVPRLTEISIILTALLATYALVQGRNNPDTKAANRWVYVGVIELVGVWIYARLVWTQLSVLDPWIAAIACIIAYIVSILPWQSWGWRASGWRVSAGILPASTALITSAIIPPTNLLIVAAFYLWFAKQVNSFRSTYISVVLLDWAISRWFFDLNLKDYLWYSTPFGLSLLYIAQFDPTLRLPSQKQNRHTLRLLGINSICVIAFLFHQDTGLIPAVLSIAAVFAGLALRIRAFLYIGTATFLLTVLYQSVVLSLNYSFFKWIIGLVFGIALISLAANFETRREQISSFVRHWLAELAEWE